MDGTKGVYLEGQKGEYIHGVSLNRGSISDGLYTICESNRGIPESKEEHLKSL